MPLIRRFADGSSGLVDLRWSFKVSTNRLWDVMTDCQVLPLWLGTHIAGNLEVDATVKIEHADDYICESRIEQIDAGSVLLMTWKFPDESESHVSLNFQPGVTGTELALIHSKLTVDVSTYLAGWQSHLTYLESVLRGTPREMDQFWDFYRKIFEN